jgi:uncharacterized SAM-binding protein YcdF (DUF218 family)
MHRLFSVLLMPLCIMWLLIITALVFYFMKQKGVAKWLFAMSFLWLIVISTGFVPGLLVSHLENQYHPLDIKINNLDSDTVYIMVLGAGLSGTSDLPANSKLSTSSVCRLVEGIRIHRLLDSSKLVFSGDKFGSLESQADVMAQAAISLGVDKNAIEKVYNVSNTSDEAERFFSSYGRKGVLILVTDAIHMPRAMKIFRKAGLDPIASPSRYLVRNEPALPLADNIRIMEMVLHEYFGLAWNTATGY